MNWICHCGALSDERLDYCPACNGINTFHKQVMVQNRTVSSSSAEIVSGLEVLNRGQKPIKMNGPWSILFPEGFHVPVFMAVYGPAGSGKSTLGLECAHSWNGNALYHAIETGLGASISSLMARLEVSHFSMAAPVCWDEVRRLSSERKFDLIVVDSVQRLGLDANTLRCEFCDSGRSVIALSQINCLGEAKGGTAIMHEADVCVEMTSYRKFTLTKNRNGDLFSGEF